MIYIIHITTINLFMVEWCRREEKNYCAQPTYRQLKMEKLERKKWVYTEQAIALNWFVYV